MSERITFTADDDTLQRLDAVEQREDIDSTAAAVRACITESAELQQRVDELQHDLADAEQTIDRLRNQKQTLIENLQREDRTQELVEYVEEREQAGALTRAKWWLLGRDD